MSITTKSILLNGLLIATGSVLSDAILSNVDTIFPTRKSKNMVKIVVAGILVVGTVAISQTLLRDERVERVERDDKKERAERKEDEEARRVVRRVLRRSSRRDR